VKQPANAEDIVQEIFIPIHRNLSTVEDEARLPAWLFTVARSAIADHFRKNSRPVAALAEDFDPPAPTVDPEITSAMVMELSTCLEPMVETLPSSYREAIRPIELSGMKQAAAAKDAGLSVSGMKTRVQRGRQKLKDRLLQCCEVELDKQGAVMNYKPRDGSRNPCTSDQQNSGCAGSTRAVSSGHRR
jgi:RNA polymerase sigma-70 factor (ECF subfamily)